MNMSSRAILSLAATLAVVSCPTRAQSQWIGGSASASAEIGWRRFNGDLGPLQRAKFDEYKATPSGLLFQQVNLAYASADSFSVFRARAHAIGEADQTVAVGINHPGKFDVQARWDRIPHVFSTNARSL